MKYILVPVIILLSGGINFFSRMSLSGNEKYSKPEIGFFEPQDQKQDKGIGPVKELKLGPVDKKLAAQGQQLFSAKCVACHSLDQKIIGPPLRNVTKTRTPEYIMNMILNPSGMEKGDPVTKQLHKNYLATPMTDQSFTQDQARSMLEYLRSSEK